MLFGDPLDFAIEIYHEPTSPKWLGFGRMRIIVQGRNIGIIEEEHCSLFHAVNRIIEVAKSLSTLWDPRFSEHTNEEIYYWLDAILYSGEISGTHEKNIDRFDFLTNTGEQFDDSKTFVISTPEHEVRILYFQDKQFGSASCKASTFISAAENLEIWFQTETKENYRT